MRKGGGCIDISNRVYHAGAHTCTPSIMYSLSPEVKDLIEKFHNLTPRQIQQQVLSSALDEIFDGTKTMDDLPAIVDSVVDLTKISNAKAKVRISPLVKSR